VVIQSFRGLAWLARFRQLPQSVSPDTHGLQKHGKKFNDFIFAPLKNFHQNQNSVVNVLFS